MHVSLFTLWHVSGVTRPSMLILNKNKYLCIKSNRSCTTLVPTRRHELLLVFGMF